MSLLVAAFITTALAVAPPSTGAVGYYAQPTINGDRIVFQAAGDLWSAQIPADGKRALAQRLTSAPGLEARPALSPDGSQVAYTGFFDGNAEVFVMPAAGGTPKRLTFHPGRDQPIGWTSDGTQILFRSDRSNVHGDFDLFLVPAAGGPAKILPFGEGMLGSFNRSTGELAFNPRSNESWYWKGYRGGTAPDIWVADAAFKQFRRITKTDENELFPMWVGDRIWFLADTDGRMNLWSCKSDGSDRTQHTHAGAQDFDLRWPSADSSGAPRIAYTQGSDIYLLDTATGSARKLDIALQGDRLQDRERVEAAGPSVTQLALSADAHRLAVVSRGEVLIGPVGKPQVGVLQSWLQVPGLSGSREAGVAWAPDGTIMMISDRGGEASIVSVDADALSTGAGEGLQVVAKGDRWLFAPEPSPDGSLVAFGDKSLRLLLVNLQSHVERVIGTSPAGEITDYKFSPDGRWLAWVSTLATGLGEIHIYDAKNSVDRTVSSGLTDDRFPRWDPKGQYLYFASARDVNPELDQFDASFATRDSWRFYAVPLRASLAPPVQPAAAAAGLDLKKWAQAPPDESDGDEADEGAAKHDGDGKHEPDSKHDGAGKAAAPAKRSAPSKRAGDGKPKHAAQAAPGAEEDDAASLAIEIDFDGFLLRATALPAESGTFRDVNAVYGGLVYLRVPQEGVADEVWPPPVLGPPGAKLERLDLVKGETKALVEHPVNFAAVAVGARAVVVASTTPGGPAGAKSSAAPAGGGAPVVSVISLTGEGEPETVALSSANLTVDVAAEWSQIFDEAWRLQRDFYWKPDLGGVDWKAIRARYAALLPRIQTRMELNDLVGEMSAELGTSHTYIDGGDAYDKPPTVNIGLLGIDATKVADGFRIDAILPDDSANGGPESPLAAPHRGVHVGDVIVAVDGRSAAGASELGELLRGRAEQQVALAIRGAEGPVRVVEVTALGDELPLRYAGWVESNRRWVSEKSNGRLGYMHLPDMDSEGLIAFVKGFYPQYLKDGLVIDERWNHGGYVSQMMLERLRRKPIAADVPREGIAATYPQRATSGPMAVLVNERAGSDGDIFPTGWRLYGLGPIIGTRTWGGVVGIRSDKPFVDGGGATQPEFAWWDPVVGYKLENHGVDPDIVVERTPADLAAGRDPQLERALAELLPKLGKEPALKPPVAGKGNTTPPPSVR